MIAEAVVETTPKPHEPLHPGREPGKREPADKPHDPAKPKDPDERPEPNEGVAAAPSMVTFSIAQFQMLVDNLRKPIIDPMKEERTKRMREHNQRLRKDQRKMLVSRFYSCNHMQLPGSVLSGCAVIAWGTQSDGVKRGTCMHCGTIFSPHRQECASQEIWEAYATLVRIPTHPGGNFHSIFQSA